MAIENGELMHECFPKHLRMGTARLKSDNETEEESKKKRMIAERNTVDKKKNKSSPVTLLSRHVRHARQCVFVSDLKVRKDLFFSEVVPACMPE